MFRKKKNLIITRYLNIREKFKTFEINNKYLRVTLCLYFVQNLWPKDHKHDKIFQTINLKISENNYWEIYI